MAKANVKTAKSTNPQKIILITGATSGIGKVTALELAKDGNHIVIIGRNKEKTIATQNEIKAASNNQNVDVLFADISSLSDVRKVAAEFNKKYPKLDILINNAGLIMGSTREVSKDGHEMTFASNHLGHFLLTALVFDKLKKSSDARIINVSSKAHTGGVFDAKNLHLETGYSYMKSYSNSKLYNILFTQELARRLKAKKLDVAANSLHPGVISTGFGQNSGIVIKSLVTLLKPILLTPEKGALTTLHLARNPEGGKVSGLYFYKEKPVSTDNEYITPQNEKELWEISEKLTGVKFL